LGRGRSARKRGKKKKKLALGIYFVRGQWNKEGQLDVVVFASLKVAKEEGKKGIPLFKKKGGGEKKGGSFWEKREGSKSIQGIFNLVRGQRRPAFS